MSLKKNPNSGQNPIDLWDGYGWNYQDEIPGITFQDVWEDLPQKLDHGGDRRISIPIAKWDWNAYRSMHGLNVHVGRLTWGPLEKEHHRL